MGTPAVGLLSALLPAVGSAAWLWRGCVVGCLLSMASGGGGSLWLRRGAISSCVPQEWVHKKPTRGSRGRTCGHCPEGVVSGSGSGGDAKVLLDVLEDAVADGTGLLDVAGLEREAKALCRGIRFVDGDMAPPHSPVVPQVMVRVVIIDPHGNLGLLRHGMYVLF